MLSLPRCRFHVVASTFSLPRCRFHVVASEWSLPRYRFQVVARERERETHGSHVHKASVLARAFLVRDTLSGSAVMRSTGRYWN